MAPVTPGRIIIEAEGVSYEIAKEALRLAAQKLPITTKQWKIEDESRALQMIERADTVELIVPGGLTMWYIYCCFRIRLFTTVDRRDLTP